MCNLHMSHILLFLPFKYIHFLALFKQILQKSLKLHGRKSQSKNIREIVHKNVLLLFQPHKYEM